MKIFDRSLLTMEESGHRLNFAGITFSRMSELIFTYILTTIQAAMVAGFSDEATAVVNIVGQVTNIFNVLFSFITLGMTINMSILLGQGKRKEASVLSGTAFCLCISGAVVASGVLSVFAPKLLNVMNVEAYMMQTAVGYIRMVAIFFPLTIFLSYLNNVLVCEGYSSRVLVINTLNSIVVILFSYIALYSGVDIFDNRIVAMGFFGNFSRIFAVALSLYFFCRHRCPFSFRLKFRWVRSILAMGVPSGMNGVSYQIAQAVTTSFIALLGVAVFNTKVYISSIIIYSHIVSMSMAQATGVFMGRYRGRGEYDKIEKMHTQNTIIAVFCNVAVSLVIWIFHRQLIGIFTESAEAIRLSGTIMLIDILVEAARAVNHINEQSLSANGDVKVMLVASVISCWLCGILFAYILGIRLGFGLVGVWIGFLLEESFKTVAYSLRWRTKKWQLIKIGEVKAE